MKQYFTGLITGILFTTSIIMFIGARTVNVTKKNLGHIVVKSITMKDEQGISNIYPGTIILKDKNLSETVLTPDIVSINNYTRNNDRELSLTNEKLVFKKNGYVNYTLPHHRLN
ncbi:MAG: hypothetical protein CMG74_06215 [Candidatus Marinimicrobia bacterium]|nr:hypothetical protein [Candidatus Neomarinimicrobiota bacterium]|tara:strand:+ start:3581 stop:3922 length:342 start_codon:yes stop_codon:yes gene_type:complete